MSLEHAFIVQENSMSRRVVLPEPEYLVANRSPQPMPVYSYAGVLITTVEPNCSVKLGLKDLAWEIKKPSMFDGNGQITPMTMV